MLQALNARFQQGAGSKIRNLLQQLSYLPQTFGLIWKASRHWTTAWLILLLIQGVLPAATVYLTRSIVDGLVVVIGNGTDWKHVQVIAIPVILMALVLILTECLQGIGEWIRTAQSELVQDYVNGLIHQQSATIDYSYYESSEFNDYLERAKEGASTRSLALLESTGALAQNSITLLTMTAILLPYGWWLPTALLISAIPTFYLMLRTNLLQYRWSQKTTTDRRRLQYYDMLLTSSWSAAEVRLFNLAAYFQPAYQRLRGRLRREQIRLVQQQSIYRLFAGLLAIAITGIVLLWMGRQVLLGLLTLGDLALFYQAFNQGQMVIKSSLSSLGQIYKNSLFVGNLFEFLQLQPQLVDPGNPVSVPATLKQGIRLRNVTFRYPGSSEPTLEGFNLTIPAGKVVAIVGDNGAGKSTLIKLICRFYDPEVGSIEIDGTDIRNFAATELRRLITVLFQFPVPYYVSAAENIALGDIFAASSQSEIETAAKGAGIHDKIMRLPQQYHSQLGKWFPGGVDLSGGQWQRLALARAFLRQAQLIMLDEPTSAMDPWAEFDWLERFRTMAAGQTALVITHRFTLAMRADIIHVMKEGRIVESGSHHDLLMQDGFYAKSWKEQMQTGTSLVESSTH